MIELKNVTKKYGKGEQEVVALDDISLNIPNNGLLVITGESGSGKTTLLNIISGIDTNTSGSINGIKKEEVSFIFQDCQLLEKLSIEDNLLLCCNDKIMINNSLTKVGLEKYKNKRINELSGGQKQRVAIARALCLNSQYIFCDEPTGNLDSKNANNIALLLKDISKERLVLVVSHDINLFKSLSDRLINLCDGKIVSDEIYTNKDDIEKSSKQRNLSISLKKIFKIKKSIDNKNFSTKAFNIIFSSIILLFSFVGIDIFSNSYGDIVIKACSYYQMPLIDIKNKENDFCIFKEDIDSSLLKENLVYGIDISAGLIYDPTALEYKYYFNKLYITNEVKSDMNCGKNTLLDDEVILSYESANKINEYINASNSEMSDFTSIVGSKICIYGKELHIVGIEKKVKFDVPNHYMNYDSLLESYQYDNSYFYCNQKTFDAIMNETHYQFSKVSLELSYLEGYFSVDKKTRIMISSESGSIFCGRQATSSNEIVVSSSFADKYFINRTDCLNKSIDLKLSKPFNERFYRSEYVIVGVGEYNSIYYDDYMLGIEGRNNDYFDGACSSIGIFTTETKAKVLDNLSEKYYLSSVTFDECINSYRISRIIGGTALVLVIPLSIILFLFQFVSAKQEIYSHRRIIGIFKSLSFSNQSIEKLFVYNIFVENFISCIISISLSSLVIDIVNYIFVSKDLTKYSIIAYKPYFLLIMCVIIGIISLIGIKITLIKFKKKSDIDLIYER